MEIKIFHPTETVSVLQLEGKFTIEDVNTFKQQTAPLIREPVKYILANFAHLKYIDSSGIGSMILLMNTAKNLNIELIIYNLQNEIMNIFRIAYLDKFFRIASALELKKTFPGVPL
jgi:anti-anti-sigma factor